MNPFRSFKQLSLVTLLVLTAACVGQDYSEGSAPPPPPAPPPEVNAPELSELDQLLASMEMGAIAFNVPEKMNISDVTDIELVLSVQESAEELMESVTAEGERLGLEIRVSNRMTAELKGNQFEITSITPSTQAISRVEQTMWRWEIEPLEEGDHQLYLTLSAILEIEGSNTTRTLKTLSQPILVEVTNKQRITMFFDEHWKWLWAAIFFPVAGGLRSRYKSRKDKAGDKS